VSGVSSASFFSFPLVVGDDFFFSNAEQASFSFISPGRFWVFLREFFMSSFSFSDSRSPQRWTRTPLEDLHSILAAKFEIFLRYVPSFPLRSLLRQSFFFSGV